MCMHTNGYIMIDEFACALHPCMSCRWLLQVLLSTHAVLTFGSNEYGQLGHSAGKPAHVSPRAIMGMGSGTRSVIQIACGDEHTVLLTCVGEVYACGNGVHGALGLGSRYGAFTCPVQW